TRLEFPFGFRTRPVYTKPPQFDAGVVENGLFRARARRRLLGRHGQRQARAPRRLRYGRYYAGIRWPSNSDQNDNFSASCRIRADSPVWMMVWVLGGATVAQQAWPKTVEVMAGEPTEALTG